MSVYTIIIGEGSQEHSFQSARTQFTPRITNSWSEGNVLDKTTEGYVITGRLVGAGPDFAATTMALWKDLRVVVKRGQPQRFRIMRDSTAEVDLQPGAMISGPFVDDFAVVPTGASFSNHVAYTLLIRAVPQSGAGELFPSTPEVQNLRRSIEIETFNNEPVRKEWSAIGQGADAFDLVRSFRPTDVEPLREIVRKDLDTGVVQGRFIWVAADDPRLSTVETIILVPGGRPIVPLLLEPDGEEEGFDPLLFKGRRRPAIVRVTGTRTGPT